MPDFKFNTYKKLITALLKSGYKIISFKDWLYRDFDKCVILRHDVDKMPQNALKVARFLQSVNISATFYFRIVPCSFKPDIVQKIAGLGHEIGYHYEDITITKGNVEKAIKHFETSLKLLREYYPVETICMHGSPLSKWDNKLLWKHYDYKKYGIKGEPYFDIDFNKVLYLTDTGRTWNGNAVSVRDKVTSQFDYQFQKTNDIIKNIEHLPGKIMINIHPQRWNNNMYKWFKELVMQHLKNIVKKYLIKRA